MRPLTAAALALLAACSETPEREPLAADTTPLDELPASFQQIVAVQTSMLRRGLYERPRMCPDFRLNGEAREMSWDAIARLLDAPLGERLGTTTTIADYAPDAGTIVIRSDSMSSDAVTNTAWTLRMEDASAGANSDAEPSGAEGSCVAAIAITDLTAG